MMTTNLTIVTQLPIVKKQLEEASKSVEAKVQLAMDLVCTEDSVKAIKETRASMNKELKEFEEKRKQIKEEVMKPYEEFEKIYKEKISDKYKLADEELKSKIDSVENELKEEKKQEVVDYFNEYSKSKNIDFVTFEQAKINITLSASMKSLKEQVTTFIDRVTNDLLTISSQTDEIEILVEYKKTLDVNQAIQTVSERKKVIEETKSIEPVVAPIEKEEVVKKNSDEFVIVPIKRKFTITVNCYDEQFENVKRMLNLSNIEYEVKE